MLLFTLCAILIASFYCLLFRSALRHGRQRHLDTFAFANSIPLSTLSALEINALRAFLSSSSLLEACARGPFGWRCSPAAQASLDSLTHSTAPDRTIASERS
mmetsp:Transcript_43152/g.86800  ORF Transcript_43152/g.86800 Transcript_43152/m.86800 type:complete len:102 (+) Transcript_43152:1-306(+)